MQQWQLKTGHTFTIQNANLVVWWCSGQHVHPAGSDDAWIIPCGLSDLFFASIKIFVQRLLTSELQYI